MFLIPTNKSSGNNKCLANKSGFLTQELIWIYGINYFCCATASQSQTDMFAKQKMFVLMKLKLKENARTC